MKVLSRLELDAHARQQFGERSLKRKRQDLTVSDSCAVSRRSLIKVSTSHPPTTGVAPWSTMTGAYNPATTQQLPSNKAAPFTANPVLQDFQNYRQEVLIPATSAASTYQPPTSAMTCDFTTTPSAGLSTPATSSTNMELNDFDVMSLLGGSVK
jgi:hypothetical protein